MWVVSFTPRPLHPQRMSLWFPLDRRLGGPRAGLEDMKKRKFLTLPRLELRHLGLPARSQSLYRLRCLYWGVVDKIQSWLQINKNKGQFTERPKCIYWNISLFLHISDGSTLGFLWEQSHDNPINSITLDNASRLQWPRGVRHELSSPARTLRS
jgi:hypothetical protein